MRCAVHKCNSAHGKGKQCKFYSFPGDATLKKKWKDFCNRPKDFNTANARICSLHFVPNDIERSLRYEWGFSKKDGDKLKPGTVPTVKQFIEIEQFDSDDFSKTSSKTFQQKYVETMQLNSAQRSEYQCDPDLPEDSLTPPVTESYQLQCVEILQPEDTFEYKIDFQSEIETKLAITNDHQYAYKTDLVDIKKETIALDENEKQIYELQQEIDNLRKENFKLKEREKKTNTEINGLKKIIENNERDQNKLEHSLRQLFSEGQVKKLKSGNRRQVWSEADIAESITWYAASPKTYTLLRKKNYPLPGIRTLQKWTQKINISPGVLEPVMKLLTASTHLDEDEKVCVLSFDEMTIRKCYSYDRSSDTTMAPCGYVQVAMLRGLKAKWRHPIFYAFDSQMTTAILFDILDKVKACGYHTVAIVANLGGETRKLLNDLDIEPDKPWFSYDNHNIYVFADVPHLIKQLRNQFLDHGFIIDGNVVKKDIISKLISLDPSEIPKICKITNKHLDVDGDDRNKVKLAIKLFSNTTSQSLAQAASLGFFYDENWIECYQLLKLTNDWFDVMNVRTATEDSREHIPAYGMSLDIQNKILNEMSELVMNMRVIGKSNLLQFQKGIIQVNNALKLLFDDVKSRFGFKYILTYRLNQEILDNFFGTICSTGGGLSDHPNCQQFKYRLRSQILGTNVEVDDTTDVEAQNGPVLKATKQSSDANSAPNEDDGIITEDGDIEHLARYICQKLHNDNPVISVDEEANNSLTWMNYVDEDGLLKPTDELIYHIKCLDNIFIEFNEDKVRITSNYLEQLLNLANQINCGENVKKIFFKTRMYSRIRLLNSDLEQNVYRKKRKYNKTMT